MAETNVAAMTELTPESPDRNAVGNQIALDVELDADGNWFINTGKEILVLDNVDTVPRTLTIQTPLLIDGDLAAGEREITLADGQQFVIGPFPVGIYSEDHSEGKIVVFTTDGKTTNEITGAVIKCP